jgi:hypothetical protein
MEYLDKIKGAVERYLTFVELEGNSSDVTIEIEESLWSDEYLRFCFVPGDPQKREMGTYINFNRQIGLSKPNLTFDSPIILLPYQIADLINIKKYFDSLDKINMKIHGKKNRKDIINLYDQAMCRMMIPFSNSFKKRIPKKNNAGYFYHIIDNNYPENGKKIEEWGRIKLCKEQSDRYYNKGLNSKNCTDLISKIKNNFPKPNRNTQEFVVIDIYLSEICSGIDIVNQFRKADERNKCIPIIIVSKHFSDHTVADALLLSKADWFISKGVITKNSNDYEKLEELFIISCFLNGLRYREYLIYFLLFLKFFVFYSYFKKTNIEKQAKLEHEQKAELLRISDFIYWLEGKKGDLPKHKPHFVTCLAEINEKIARLSQVIEEQIKNKIRIPKEVFHSWINEVYTILEKEIEPRKNWIDLTVSNNDHDKFKLSIPFNGGEVDAGYMTNLLEISSNVDKNKIEAWNTPGKSLYLIWQELLSDIVEENVVWK